MSWQTRWRAWEEKDKRLETVKDGCIPRVNQGWRDAQDVRVLLGLGSIWKAHLRTTSSLKLECLAEFALSHQRGNGHEDTTIDPISRMETVSMR